MLDSLNMIYERLKQTVQTDYHRFLYASFHIENRLTGLIGPRGVGKTTLLLQYIKEHHAHDRHCFYFSADHIYFKEMSVYEFVESLYLNQGINLFFIDEIHKYENWSQELKNLYDGFPDLRIVFSGSSSLDLVKGSYDLSRRAKMYSLPGMSFREYLSFIGLAEIEACDLHDLIMNSSKVTNALANFPGILGHFHNYLKQGFYPFFQEDPLSYYEKILSIIEKTIYEDIGSFYNLKTTNLRLLSKILNFLASVPPGKISTYNLGKNLKIDDKTAAAYLVMLSETGLVEMIYPAETGNQSLRKPEKVFFNNTNLHYALSSHLTFEVDIGTIRELAFVQATKNAGLMVSHNKHAGYQIENIIFEIGGKNISRKQIQGQKDAYLVKDDITVATQGCIPLIYFGFLY